MKKLPYRLWISLTVLLGVSLACSYTLGDSGSQPPPASTSTQATAGSTSSATPTQPEVIVPTATHVTNPTSTATKPPEPTSTPVIQASAPKVSNNGGFGDCPLNLTCDDSFSAETLSAVNAHFPDSNTNGDGVANVVFEIWDSNESVKFYERQENNPVYCTFGGDGPCNSWTFENGAFRWTPGGAAVEPGDYVVVMTINGTTPDENGNSQGQLRHFFWIETP